jgi:hypothetical protein
MSSTVRTVSLNDVVVGSQPTHIVIYQESNNAVSNAPPQPIEPLQAEIKELRERVAQLERFIESLDGDAPQSVKPSPYFHAQISGPVGLEVRRLEEPPAPVATVFETLVKSVRATPALAPKVTPLEPVAPLEPAELEEAEVDEEEAEQEEAEQEEAEQQQEEGDADNEAEEDVEADEEVEEEVEEEAAMELVEFEYKGHTYYRDAENQVYEKDEEGDLDDDPIGVWNEAKQKVLKYPKK